MRRQEEGTTNARWGRSNTLATAWATSSGPGSEPFHLCSEGGADIAGFDQRDGDVLGPEFSS